jgi:hypothetical protein
MFDRFDERPPSPPENVRSINGDERVDIYWDPNPERDVIGYNVYYSYSYDGKYKLIGNTSSTHFIDYDANNGVTYYYAVTAYNYDGIESDLSKDEVYNTPRPEGFNVSIFDYRTSPNNSGYSFAKNLIYSFNNKETDFFFENYNGVNYVDVWGDDADIQDMGRTNDIYDISTAPLTGWVTQKIGENIKYAQAVVGHTYVIWTIDNHFAKIRIKSITNGRMVFDWAYQLVPGNIQLKIRNNSTERVVPDKVIRNY